MIHYLYKVNTNRTYLSFLGLRWSPAIKSGKDIEKQYKNIRVTVIFKSNHMFNKIYLHVQAH